MVAVTCTPLHPLSHCACFRRDLSKPLHDAAVAQYLQSVNNSTIGNVPVVIGVPKGVQETGKANTKVLLYMHGERLRHMHVPRNTSGHHDSVGQPF